MKIFIHSGEAFENHIADIATQVEKMGHQVSYSIRCREAGVVIGTPQSVDCWCNNLTMCRSALDASDAILVINYPMDGENGYIDGTAFLLMYHAHRTGKQIYLMEPTTQRALLDEVTLMKAKVIFHRLENIK